MVIGGVSQVPFTETETGTLAPGCFLTRWASEILFQGPPSSGRSHHSGRASGLIPTLYGTPLTLSTSQPILSLPRPLPHPNARVHMQGTHTHTHTHTHIWCYLGHRGVVPCDILHMPVEHNSPTKHSLRQSGICICMRCQIIDVANKTAEEECRELTNICNKVVENQIKCHQRYMEPHTPIALFISKE